MFKVDPLVVYLFICLGTFSNFGFSATRVEENRQWNEDMGKIGRVQSYINQTKKKMRMGEFSEAFELIKKAIAPELHLRPGYPDGVARSKYQQLLWLKGSYGIAVDDLKPLFDYYRNEWPEEPVSVFLLDLRKEFEADLNWQKTGDKKYLYDFITHIKQKHAGSLPSKGTYNQGVTEHAAQQIIRTYDLLGNYDAGIEFVDSFSKMRAKGKFFSSDSKKYAYSDKDPYYQVQKAFQADKAEGKTGCLPQRKPGEYCVGRATRVLIESKNFTM